MISQENLVIFITASIRKKIEAAGIGIQVKYMQQGDNGEEKVQDEVQVSQAFHFPDRGSMTELYALVNVTAIVKTKIVASDIYYHTRIKARVADLLSHHIPVYKIGGPDTAIYDKSQVGILRKCDSETVMSVGLDNPDASMIEAFYEFQEC